MAINRLQSEEIEKILTPNEIYFFEKLELELSKAHQEYARLQNEVESVIKRIESERSEEELPKVVHAIVSLIKDPIAMGAELVLLFRSLIYAKEHGIYDYELTHEERQNQK
jgi:hypothetical protein